MGGIRDARSGLALKDFAGVGEVEFGEVEAGAGLAFLGDLKLQGDALDGGGGEVLDGADAHLGFEDDEQQAVFIHAGSEQAEFLALLVDAVEVGFVEGIKAQTTPIGSAIFNTFPFASSAIMPTVFKFFID